MCVSAQKNRFAQNPELNNWVQEAVTTQLRPMPVRRVWIFAQSHQWSTAHHLTKTSSSLSQFYYQKLLVLFACVIKSEQQNNFLDIYSEIEFDTNSVDISTVLSPNEAFATETTNLRDSPPSYTDVGPPPNYEDFVKDQKVSILWTN